jgi:hypothetical protein
MASAEDIAKVQMLVDRARERGLTSVPQASLERLLGETDRERTAEVAAIVGLSRLTNGTAWELGELSFAEVVGRISRGEKLPGISEVENVQIRPQNVCGDVCATKAPKPWE